MDYGPSTEERNRTLYDGTLPSRLPPRLRVLSLPVLVFDPLDWWTTLSL